MTVSVCVSVRACVCVITATNLFVIAPDHNQVIFSPHQGGAGMIIPTCIGSGHSKSPDFLSTVSTVNSPPPIAAEIVSGDHEGEPLLKIRGERLKLSQWATPLPHQSKHYSLLRNQCTNKRSSHWRKDPVARPAIDAPGRLVRGVLSFTEAHSQPPPSPGRIRGE